MSTGTMSATHSRPPIRPWMAPMYRFIIMPVGPVKSSTKPGEGSRQAPPTIDGLMMATGILPAPR